MLSCRFSLPEELLLCRRSLTDLFSVLGGSGPPDKRSEESAMIEETKFSGYYVTDIARDRVVYEMYRHKHEAEAPRASGLYRTV